MKFNEKWLREWVNPKISTNELVDQLTMIGLEVDSVDAVKPAFSNVVIAKIEFFQQHPDAERLNVCQVNAGDVQCQIVCGAPNIYQGMYAALALPGAILGEGDKPFKIKKSKLRGVASEGMLCGASELGFVDKVDGLWDLNEFNTTDNHLGIAFEQFLNLDDSVIDVDLTPNRGDCLSIRGLAREVSVANQIPMQIPFEAPVVNATFDDKPEISITDTQACSRYIGRYIRNVDLSVQTPDWMRSKLEHAGVRCHDAIVDITNYVLLELGQPLHAFDADKLDGRIGVRMSESGEHLTTLDAKELTLQDNSLVITDGGKPIALAGIMGGNDSAVNEATKNIMLESAFFHPLALAGRARQYGLHTDASHRFERGVDPELTKIAIERATQLIIDISGGEAGALNDVVSDQHQQYCRSEVIEFEHQFINNQLGIEVDTDTLKNWFDLLGFNSEYNNGIWNIQPASWRFDIAIAEDIIEEVARLYGYDKLPIEPLPALEITNKTVINTEQLYRQSMINQGFNEAISYSFIAPELASTFTGNDGRQRIEVTNPLAVDMSCMRQTLLAGLVSTAKYNINRQSSDLKLFEIGQCFNNIGNQYSHSNRIAAIMTGNGTSEHWSEKSQVVDFYDIKGVVENLLATIYPVLIFEQDNSDANYHPGQCAIIKARLSANEVKTIGRVGAINPKIINALDISQDIFAFELILDLEKDITIEQFSSISPFPSTRRDIAFEVSDNVDVGDIIATINQRRSKLLKDIIVFDIYKGRGVSDGCKSVALGLIISSDKKTLEDKEVQHCVDSIIEHLKKQFKIVMR